MSTGIACVTLTNLLSSFHTQRTSFSSSFFRLYDVTSAARKVYLVDFLVDLFSEDTKDFFRLESSVEAVRVILSVRSGDVVDFSLRMLFGVTSSVDILFLGDTRSLRALPLFD